jgi:hypothetical protein
MGTPNNGVAFAYSYGLAPDEVNEFLPRMFIINDVTDANGNYLADLSEAINQNLIGNIQSVMMTLVGAAATTQLVFTHGVSGVRVSTAPWTAGFDGKSCFPYFAPADARQHTLKSTVGGAQFQLVFTNVPLPIVNGGNSF